MFKWLCIIIGYLMFSSAIMGYFVYEKDNVRINTLSPNFYTTNTVDFTDNQNMTEILDTSIGGYQYCYIENNMLYITPPLIGDVSIYFKGIQPNEWGVYEVEYGINNSENGDFSIIITSETNSFSPQMLSMRYRADAGFVDILYAENTLLGQYFAAPYFTESIDLSGSHKIKTEFNPNSKTLILTIDDVIICQANINNYDSDEVIHYAGGIISTNFVIEYLHANIVYITNPSDDTDFFSTIATILVWNVSEEYLPSFFNFLFIKIPMIFLGISIALYVRGIA